MAASSEKITVYNLADLLHTSDDAIANYLNSLSFTQSHTLTDTRLALGYSSLLLAASCFLWDYKFGFESTKLYTAVAVLLYAAISGALVLYAAFVEKKIVYVGTAPSGEKVTISTSVVKNVPVYDVVVKVTTAAVKGRGDEATRDIKLSRSFTEWFDEAGHFVAAPFQSFLASGIDVVGKLDPKRAGPAPTAAPAANGTAAGATEYSEEMLNAIMTSSATTGAKVPSEARKTPGGRRKKG